MPRDRKADRFPYIERGRLKKAVVVCHRNADADSYLSAYGISCLLRKVAPRCEVEIATPGGMTLLTGKLEEKFHHKIVDSASGDYDLYVAVDVGDAELLGEWRKRMQGSQGVKVLVDHHPLRDRGAYDFFVVDEEATSAAEVVVGLFSTLRARMDPKTAQALLTAILFDSSHLAIAGPGGVKAAVKLMDSGADIVAARRDLRTEPDYGEVLAKLKGAQRLEAYRLGDWVASTSRVGSFQAHVARALVYLGSDVAVVGGESEGETRVSLRSTQRFADKTKVHLGTQVAEAEAAELGGHGGGHSTAASFSTSVGEEEAVEKTLKRVAQLLGAEVRKIPS